MSQRTIAHSTFVIERNYPASPERVFAAFSDPARKRRWFAEGDEHKIQEYTLDFRVDGREVARFRGGNGMTFTNETIFRDIQPARHIVLSYTMAANGKCISSSQASFEFLPSGQGATLVFTEQAAFFEGADGPQMRETGWQQLLDQLAKYLAN